MANQSFFGLSPQETALALEQERMQQLPQNKPYFAGDINFAVANQNLRELGPRVRAAIQERSFKPLIEGGMGGFRDPRMQRALLLDEARQEVTNSGVSFDANPIDYYNSAFTSLMKRGLVDEANQVRTQALAEMEALRPTATQQTSPYEFKDGVVLDKYTGRVVGTYPTKGTESKPSYGYLQMPDGTVMQSVKGSPEETAALAQGAVPYSKPTKEDTPELGPAAKALATAAGKETATKLQTSFDVATKAPEVLNNALAIESALNSGAIAGSGAGIRLAFAKALNIAGATNDETIAASEELFKQLAKQTLSAIPTAGLGTGQGFTNQDREFVKQAVSGTAEMNPITLRSLAKYMRYAAENSGKVFTDSFNRLSEENKNTFRGLGLSPEALPKIPEIRTVRDLSKVPDGVDPELWNSMDDDLKIQYLRAGRPTKKKKGTK